MPPAVYRRALARLAASVGGTVEVRRLPAPMSGIEILIDAPDGTTWDGDIAQYVGNSWQDAYERVSHAVEKMGGPLPSAKDHAKETAR